jgi:dipeptidase E
MKYPNAPVGWRDGVERWPASTAKVTIAMTVPMVTAAFSNTRGMIGEMRLLLISNSTLHGGGYLDHCAGAISSFLAPSVSRVLFVPYAVFDRSAYAAKVRGRFAAMKLAVDSIHDTPGGPLEAIERAQALFVGGGNTFRLLDWLWRERLIDPIRRRVREGMPYVGSSAGSNVACPSIRTTNDMPIVQPASFEALNLVPFNINPHYQDPIPGSTHMGETREERIREFHEENTPPVLGLREGAWLWIDAGTVALQGSSGARLFRGGEPPVEFAPGARLDFLCG